MSRDELIQSIAYWVKQMDCDSLHMVLGFARGVFKEQLRQQEGGSQDA